MNFALGSPLLLATGALGAAIIAVYIFHRRPREQEVSSLVLWQGLIQPGGAGRQREKLRAPWLLALELLIVALLALAAATPLLTSSDQSRSVIVVLDDSFSMSAADSSGQTPRDRALADLDSLLTGYQPRRTAFVLAAPTPGLLSIDPAAPSSADALDKWSCRSPAADLLGSIRLAFDIGSESTDIIVLTDHEPPADIDYGPRVRWLAFGEPLPNIAITGAARSSTDTAALIEVTNSSDEAQTRSLLIERPGATPASRDITVQPGSTGRFRIPVDPQAEVTVRLAPPDALAADDSVLLVPEDFRPVPVLVRTDDEQLEAAALQWIRADPTVTQSITGRAELLVTDDQQPGPPGAWVVRISRPAADAARPFAGPFIINQSHEIAEGLDLSGLIWATDLEADSADPAPAGLLSADPIVVLASRTVVELRRFMDGHRELFVRVDPGRSNLTAQVAWPVLLSNAARLRSAARPGPVARNVAVGRPVRISAVQGSTDPILIVEPDGTERSIRASSADYTPVEPGLYTVRIGDRTDRIAANLLSVSESDISAAATVRLDPDSSGGEDPSRITRDLAWLAAILAASALAAHGLTVSRIYRQGGSV